MSRFHLCQPPLHLATAELSAVALSVSGLALDFVLEEDPEPFTVDDRIRATFEDELSYLRKTLKKDSVLVKPKRLEVRGKSLALVGGPILFSESLALKRSVWASQISKNLTPAEFYEPNPGLSGGMGLHLGVLSSEGRMLCIRRSPSVAVYANQWVPSLLEGLTPEDFRLKSPYWAGLRALKEELGLKDRIPYSRIRMLALLVGHQSYSWSVLGVADLRGMGPRYTAESLKLQHLSAPDRWEAADLRFINPSEDSFLKLAEQSGYSACRFAGAETTLIRLASEIPPASKKL